MTEAMFLASPAVRSLALAVIVAMGLALFRVRRGSIRLKLWTAVLYAALAMPLLNWMLPQVPLRLKVLPLGPSEMLSTVAHDTEPDVSVPLRAREPKTLKQAQVVGLAAWKWSWLVFGEALYVAVALALMLRLVVGVILASRLVRRARCIKDSAVNDLVAGLARSAKLSRVPRLAESNAVVVPATMGYWRPAIILPSDWRDWGTARVFAVLAHEMAHVARRDALTQRLSLLHRAIFWFSPLGWWLHWRLVELAEDASDDAALGAGVDQAEYAETLLGFFEGIRGVPRRVSWHEVPMARGSNVEKRIERILGWKGGSVMKESRGLAWTLTAAATPLVIIVAVVRPSPAARTAAAEPTQQAIPAPATPPAPVIAANPPPPLVTAFGAAPPPSVPPVPDSLPSKAAVIQVRPTTDSSATYTIAVGANAEYGSWYTSGGNDRGCNSSNWEHILIAVGDNCQIQSIVGSVTFSATITTKDITFTSDGSTYHITDGATVAQTRQFFQPLLDIERRQTELGRYQADLGKQQTALGQQQARLGKNQAAAVAKIDQAALYEKIQAIKVEIDRLHSEATEADLSRLQAMLGEIQAEVGRMQLSTGSVESQLGESQAELGQKQAALGKEQAELGQQQADLGKRGNDVAQDLLSRLRKLLDDAKAHGLMVSH